MKRDIFEKFCLVLFILGTVPILVEYITYPQFGSHQFGWDLRTYLGAFENLVSGGDPYSQNFENAFFPFIYPPHSLVAVVPFYYLSYALGVKVALILAYSAIIMIASVYLWKLTPQDKYLILAIIGSSFTATYWSIRTGNFSVFGFPAIVLSYYSIKEELEFLSIGLGLFASIKIYPIIFAGLFIILPIEIRRRFKLSVYAVFGFLLPISLDLMFFPNLMDGYLNSVTNYSSGLAEIGTGGIGEPSLLKFILHAFGGIGTIPLILYVALSSSVAISFIHYALRSNSHTKVFSVGIIGILAVFPRLKAYQLIISLPAIYILLANENQKNKIIGLVLFSLLPLLIRAIQVPSQLILGDPILVPLPIQYGYTIVLFAGYWFVLNLNHQISPVLNYRT